MELIWQVQKGLMIREPLDDVADTGWDGYSLTHFWIQIHNLPLHGRVKEITDRIGNQVGMCMDVDTDEQGRCWGRFNSIFSVADLVILTKNVRMEITARMFMIPSTIVFGSEDHIMIGYLLGIIIRIVPLFGLVIGIRDEIRISTSWWLEQLELVLLSLTRRKKKKATGSLSKEKGADVLPLILPVVTRVGLVLRDQDVNSSPLPDGLIFSAGLADTGTIQEPITSTKLRKPNLKTLARKKGSSSSSSRENLIAKCKIEAGGNLSEMDKKKRQVLVKNTNVLSAQAVSQPRQEQ
ncbi:hypothetical protein TorRG33x02_354280 [Trema orientale]|uniref:Uncharacterized protein n=1 Tax=Trema orientale TaxID=63057 RepID=A0A2P5ABG3_TREOI|nr:hypothetical protein TorRG33x02_354280 [Trema orientale]